MEKQVFSYIKQYQMIAPGDSVIVGVSGGADSVCLLLLLKEYQKREKFSLEAVHVHHGIRGEEADQDAEYVQNLCKRLGVPCTVFRKDIPAIAKEQGLSLEETGRNVRRELFMEVLKAKGTGVIALAHHQDDLAETMLHHLARGSGLAGFCSLKPVRLPYIRPLLCVKRQEIEAYLKEAGIAYQTDSTNAETVYTRNRIRHEILPVMKEINEKALEHMAHTATIFQKAEEYLQEQADILYKKHVKEEAALVMLLETLLQESEIMQEYVIRKALSKITGSSRDLGAVHVEGIQALFDKQTGSKLHLPYEVRGRNVYGAVYLEKEQEKMWETAEMEFSVFPFENGQIPEKTYTKWFDYDRISNSLSVRHRQPGDYLMVNADGGKKKLKDYLIDRKIPKEERDGLTVLAEGNHVLWVVGHRISSYYRITEKTKTILEVHVKGENENE